jgi:alkylation response protein AidB-like acyl-CoA dehydrogenase
VDLRESADDRTFREEVRTFLEESLAGDFAVTRGRGGPGDEGALFDERQAWERHLGEHGWTCVGWPKEYGGRGLSLRQQVAYHEEYARAQAPGRLGIVGEGLLGPTIIAFGTAEQQRRFLPPIVAGTELWCQGYSEPNAGSDLANLSTRAVRDGDEWVVTGQKVWTSLAHWAAWCFVLARTDPTVPRHKGISYLLVPMGQEEIEVRPIVQVTGDSEFNEVFFDGARTDADMVLGGEGAGWQVAMSVLGYERGTAFVAQQRDFVREYTATLERVHHRGTASDPVVRQQLAWAWTGLEIMRFSGLRTLSAVAGGRTPGPEVSIGKLFWSHWHQKMVELAMDLSGPESMVLDGGRLDHLQHGFLFSRQDTIAAGSSEIQRNIVGQRVLGLPPER